MITGNYAREENPKGYFRKNPVGVSNFKNKIFSIIIMIKKIL